MASFSNQAGSPAPYNYVDAPGSGILAYGLNQQVYSWSGTSMAAPLVATEAADLISANSHLTSQQIVQDIAHNAITLIGIA